MLHLQHATVVIADKIGDAKIEDSKHSTDEWSIQKKREVAEKVRSKLPEPEGGKVIIAEYKVRQEVREKGQEARNAEEARRRAERAERAIFKKAKKAAREDA